MSHQLPRYTHWAPASDWRRGHIILASNVKSIPTPPPQHQAVIMVDGLWGEHEWTLYPQPYRRDYPYLPWLQLPSKDASNILSGPVHKGMWQAHATKSNVHVVNPEVWKKFEHRLGDIKAAILDPFYDITKCVRFNAVQRPEKARLRAFEALDRLNKDFEGWRDFVDVVRNLQRNLLELQAFVDWWSDIRQGDDCRPTFRGPTRGAIFDDIGLYTDHARLSIASYLIIPNDLRFRLDPFKRVDLSLRESSRLVVMSNEPLRHSLQLWYYPPHVRDVYADFETAARGYADRLDTFNPTVGLKRKSDKRDNQRADNGMPFFLDMLLSSFMRRLQMAAAQRWRRLSKASCLVYRTITNFVDIMTKRPHLFGTPNDMVFGTMRCYTSTTLPS